MSAQEELPARKGSSLPIVSLVRLGMATVLLILLAAATFSLFSLRTISEELERSAFGNRAEQAATWADVATIVTLLAAALAVIAGKGFVVFISRAIRSPMEELRKGTEEFAQGNLKYRVPVVRRDEYGEVTEMLNTLAWRLQDNQATLTHQAFHDPLTGLPNRELFTDRVVQAVVRQARDPKPVAIMFIDLDDFKVVNDTLGHAAGDQLLMTVATRLRSALRPADTAARLGGDEFAVLIENVGGEKDAARLAQRVIDKLYGTFSLEGKQVMVHGSVGVATSYGGMDAAELLRNADMAMYAAKGKGKGRYEIYDGSMHEGMLERLEMRVELERALANNEFAVAYQPIVDLQTGRMVASEALVRWNHPERGMLPPSAFVPLAEESGLIRQIGDFVLREALSQLRDWQTAFDADLRMTVNMSGRQLQEPGFVASVKRALQETPMSPASLTLELTESMLMKDTKATLKSLEELRALGVSLAIDDFGTGYSSLSYLRTFPIQTIKIDRTFTQAMDQGPEDSALGRAIVKLTQTLSLNSIAEGVESAEQAEELRAAGCRFAQGYHFAKPVGAEEVEKILRTQPNRGNDAKVLELRAS